MEKGQFSLARTVLARRSAGSSILAGVKSSRDVGRPSLVSSLVFSLDTFTNVQFVREI